MNELVKRSLAEIPRSPAGRLFGNLVLFILFSIIFLWITVRISFDIMLPGVIFKLPTLTIIILAPFTLSFVLFSLVLLAKAKEKNEPRTPLKIILINKPGKNIEPSRTPLKLSKKSIIEFSIILGAFIIIYLGIVFFQDQTDNKHIANAKKLFSYIPGDISTERIDATLIELENQLARLNKAYGVNEINEKINLILYPDIASLQANNPQVPKWVLAFLTYTSGTPTIHLVAEQPSSGSRKTNPFATTTPAHEITHYILDEMLGGPKNRTKIPFWFLEGFTEYESSKKTSLDLLSNKGANRFSLWLYNMAEPQILKDKTFILDSKYYPNSNISLYYTGSMALVEYIDSEYGGIKEMLAHVSAGDRFSDAFKKITSKTIDDVYTEWYEAFFKVELANQ